MHRIPLIEKEEIAKKKHKKWMVMVKKEHYFTNPESKEEKKEEITYPDEKETSFASVGNFVGDVDGVREYTPVGKN